MAFPDTDLLSQFTDDELLDQTKLDARITAMLNALRDKVYAAYSTYAPTLVQSGAVAKTVNYAKWNQVGKTAKGNVTMTTTAVGTATNAITSSLPTAPSYAIGSPFCVGSFALVRASGARSAGAVITTGSTTIFFQDAAQSNVVGLAPVTALAIGDVLTYEFEFEVP